MENNLKYIYRKSELDMTEQLNNNSNIVMGIWKSVKSFDL